MQRNILLALSATVVATSLMVAAPAEATSGHNKDHKVGICHATGSKTNPYVYINVDKHAAEAHRKHQDGRDIIGVKSAKACPKPSASPSPSPSATPVPGRGSVQGSSTQSPEPQPTTLPTVGGGLAAALSAIVGVPAMALAGRAYLRSRSGR
jgi:hypothetical protein